MWHRGLVGPRDHELPHTLLAIPGCHGPEGPASISQYCTRLKSACASYLPQRPPGVKCEERHKSKGTDSEACQTDESHSLLRLKNFQSNPLHLVLTIGVVVQFEKQAFPRGAKARSIHGTYRRGDPGLKSWATSRALSRRVQTAPLPN